MIKSANIKISAYQNYQYDYNVSHHKFIVLHRKNTFFFVFLQHYYIIYLCPQTIFDNHGKDKIQSPS